MYKDLENVKSMGDLLIATGQLMNDYENSKKVITIKEETETLYGINEVTKIYPKLSKYILTNAINKGLLPVTWVGNQRHFYKKDIEEYLRSNTTKIDVAEELNTWRTNE